MCLVGLSGLMLSVPPSPALTTLLPCVTYISAPCCQPPLHTATAPWVPEMLRATRPEPSGTNTCGGCCISGRWTLNLPCGRCFTCSRPRRGSTATFTTGSRPRTSGPGTTLLFWFCSASGCVVSRLSVEGLSDGVRLIVLHSY